MQAGFGPSVHIGLVRWLATDQVKTARDTLKKVVEVMGNTAGQLAQRLHFLGLTKPIPLRDRRPGNSSSLAILVHKPELVLYDGFALEQLRHAGGPGLAIRRCDE